MRHGVHVMTFQSILSSLRQTWHDQQQARAHARRGHRLYQKSDYAGAAGEYEQSLSVRPEQPLVSFNLGLALYKAGRKADARARWQAVLAQAETTNPYLAEQARIMLRQFG